MQSPPTPGASPTPDASPSPNSAENTAEDRGCATAVDPPHGLLLCPLEYDIEAAQEKDRQAFKPSNILQTQKTNCDGYAGLFERMCRYQRGPARGRQSQGWPPTSYPPSPPPKCCVPSPTCQP